LIVFRSYENAKNIEEFRRLLQKQGLETAQINKIIDQLELDKIDGSNFK
jgi:hypothetical protein